MKKQEIFFNILNAVSAKTRVSVADILSQSRRADIVYARHIAMWVARYYTKFTQQEIANAMNCKRHATVIHAVNNIDYLTNKNHTLSNELHQLGKEAVKL